MTKIIFATGNKDKMREIKEIMADCDVSIISMKEAGIDIMKIKAELYTQFINKALNFRRF